MSDQLKLLVDQANEAIKNGELNDAVSLFKQSLEKDENYVDALYGLATVSIQQQDFKQALQLLSKSAELEPQAADIAMNHGYVLAVLGQRNQSLLELQRATKYCGNDFVLCGAIAELFVGLGEADGAIQLLDRLDALSPQNQIVLARAYGLKRQWAESVRILHRLSADTPEDVLVLSELATAAANHRDYRVAIDAFEKILKLKAPTSRDYLKFADLLLLAQQTERAQQAIDLAKDAGEDSADLHIINAKLARLKGDLKGARLSVENVLKAMPLNGQAWLMRAELADPDQLESEFAELESSMQNQQSFLTQPYHQQSLLFFAAAKYADRLQRFDVAANSLRQANNIRMEEQKRLRAVYDSEAATSKVQKIKDQYSEEAISSSGAKADDKFDLKPIFIVGMPRSGTTLIEKILGRHPQVHALGEQEAMMAVASDYSFYVDAGKAEAPEKLTQEQCQQMRQAYLDKISDLAKNYFTDKLPHNFENVGLILKLFPEAKIIQVHRDAQDTALSIYENPFPIGHQYANWLMDTLHAVKLSEELMQHWTALGSDQILDVNYEDLIANPNAEAEKIVGFCGLSWSQDLLNPSESDLPSFTFSELQVRQPISAGRIGRAKDYAEFLPELADA